MAATGPTSPGSPIKTKRKPRNVTPDTAPLAESLAAHVLAGTEPRPDRAYLDQRLGPSRVTRASIVAIIGPDVELFRAQLRDKFTAIASDMADAIARDIDEMPPASRAFALSVLVDKAELLGNKLSSSPRSAQVNVQINNFGQVDRNALMSQLTGTLQTTTPTTDLQATGTGTD